MKTIFILAILVATIPVFSQETFRIRVTEQSTGQILPAASIQCREWKAVVSANSRGEFEFNLNQEELHLVVSFVGYESKSLVVRPSENYQIIELSPVNSNLQSVMVRGYENNRKLIETAGSVSLLKFKDLQKGDNMDIMPALNSVPGVKMEASVTGDYRISIRGSLLNNPWGIRNVKLYWNDIPLSSPDGTASHGVDFDPGMIGSVEILKGPSGSVYGAGNGGVILFKSNGAEAGQSQLETGYTAGSYGYQKLNTSYKYGTDNFKLAASYTHQTYDGYRDNGWSNKDVLNIYSEFQQGEKRTISLFMNHATGSFGLSGALDSLQVAENPRQAISYANENKTSVKKYNTTQVGLGQQYQLYRNLVNSTSIFGSFQTLDHPYGESIYYNGYLKESTQGYGFRTKFAYAPKLGKLKSRFTVGAELMYQHQFGNTFGIINDEPGTWPETGDLFQNMITVSASKIIFAQAEIDLPAKLLLTAGASYNSLSYDITDLFTSTDHVNYTGKMSFPDKISPRIGLVKLIGKTMAVNGSISYGYAPPPLWEINNFDGTLNKQLSPEDGINYELGFKGNFFRNKLGFDLTAYQMMLTNAIVPVANEFGTTSYRNAGSTNQKGLEAVVQYFVLSNSSGMLSFLKIRAGLALNKYRFKDYQTESFDWNTNTIIKNNYSGKAVTGVVPASIIGGADLETRFGAYLNASYYYYGRTPMNDANTAWQKGYSLLNLKLGYKTSLRKWTAEIFAGINNAFNSKYSSLINLNADAVAFGAPPAWFNPAPAINYFGGIGLRYRF